MEYFTPQLYEQLNADNADIAVQAMRAWDAAEAAYLAQRAKWLRSAPAGVVDLATKLCLHDDSLMLELWAQDGQFLLVASTNEEMTILLYDAVEQPTVIPPTRSGRCWSMTRSWLYDEVIQSAPGVYRHRILFSDSSERDVVFRDVHMTIRTIEPSRILSSDTPLVAHHGNQVRSEALTSTSPPVVPPTSSIWFIVPPPASLSPGQLDIQSFFSQPQQFAQTGGVTGPH